MSNMLRSLSDAIWPPNQKNKVSPEPTDETSEEKSGPVSKSKVSNDNIDAGSGENLSPSQSSTGSMSKTEGETPSETTGQTSPSTSQVSKISSESTVRTPLGLRDYHLYYEVEDDDVALNPYCCCSATMRQAAEIVCFWDIILCIILTMILVLLGFIVLGAPGEYNAYEICALIFTPFVVVASLILYLVIKYKIYDTLVEKVCIAWLIVTILHLIVLLILSIGHIVYYIESGDELPMNGKDTQIEGNSTSNAGNGARSRADNDNNNDDSVIDNPNSEGQMLIIKVQKPKPEYLPSKESINEKRKNKYLTLIILPWIWIVLTIYFLMVIIPFLKWIRKRIKDELGDGKSEPDPENAFENPVPASGSGGQSSDESSAAGPLENPASAKRGDKIPSSEDQSQSKDKEPSGSEGKSGSNSEEKSGEKSDDKSEKPVSEDPKKWPADGLPPSDQYPDPSTYHSSQHEPEKMHSSGTEEGEPQTQPTAGGPESQEKPPESTKKSGLKSRLSSKSPKSGQKGKEPELTPSERYTAPSVYHSSQHEPEKMPPSTETPAAESSKNPKKDPKVSSTKHKSHSKKPDPELTPSERYTEPSEYHSSQHEPEKMPPSETEESSKLKAQKKNPKSYAQNRSRW